MLPLSTGGQKRPYATRAFGVSYQTAVAYRDEQWKVRASSTGTALWLALEKGRPVGMIGAAVNSAHRFNLIGMWVEPAARASGVATQLADVVKARARSTEIAIRSRAILSFAKA
ncbi:hypothetical protein B0D71_00270 [Pseudomonas laurylsulfativorans]|uniref:N-acetyltransferase domain-containing protein n=1 Tax=Pseudomonas laurylsulfativorans TaxID=1943631 RepID=A0A2S3VTM8_9PSED|nr:hypothetical protein B0D71_00270 [Pseudomonas laurylsulfativorans]